MLSRLLQLLLPSSKLALRLSQKREDQKLKLLSKRVLGLSQAEHESGAFNADLIMTEALIQDIREDRSVVKDLWGKAQETKTEQGCVWSRGC